MPMSREEYDAIVEPLVAKATAVAEKEGRKIIFVRLPDGVPCTATGLISAREPSLTVAVAAIDQIECKSCHKLFTNWRAGEKGRPPVECEPCYNDEGDATKICVDCEKEFEEEGRHSRCPSCRETVTAPKGPRTGVCANESCGKTFTHDKKGAMPLRCEECRAAVTPAVKGPRSGICACGKTFTHNKKGAMPKRCEACRAGVAPPSSDAPEAFCGGCRTAFSYTGKKAPKRCPKCTKTS